jgi:transposase
MECYVGLDVHSKASVFVIQEKCGRVIAQGEMPTTPAGFQRWQEAQRLAAGTPVALESGTVAFFVARELTALGLAPSVIDAHEVRLKAHRPTQKSDRRDAFELCDGLRRGTRDAVLELEVREVADDVGRVSPAARSSITSITRMRMPRMHPLLGVLDDRLRSRRRSSGVAPASGAYPSSRPSATQRSLRPPCRAALATRRLPPVSTARSLLVPGNSLLPPQPGVASRPRARAPQALGMTATLVRYAACGGV